MAATLEKIRRFLYCTEHIRYIIQGTRQEICCVERRCHQFRWPQGPLGDTGPEAALATQSRDEPWGKLRDNKHDGKQFLLLAIVLNCKALPWGGRLPPTARFHPDSVALPTTLTTPSQSCNSVVTTAAGPIASRDPAPRLPGCPPSAFALHLSSGVPVPGAPVATVSRLMGSHRSLAESLGMLPDASRVETSKRLRRPR